MKLVYISDYFLGETNGGAEQNDHELINILRDKDDVDELLTFKSDSNELTLERVQDLIKNDYRFIVSNFVFMFKRVMKEIEKGTYVIYEHDHKYLPTRNPADYPEFMASKDEIVNKSFYKNARVVFCQSNMHKSIIDVNVPGIETVSLGGNIWSEEILDYIEELNEKYPEGSKKKRYSIMDSAIAHKGTNFAVSFCEREGIEYDLIEPLEHKKFLERLAQNDTLIFGPATPETLSRIVVEARMLNSKLVVNTNIGAASQAWFQKKGQELIDIMRLKRETIPDIVLNVLS